MSDNFALGFIQVGILIEDDKSYVRIKSPYRNARFNLLNVAHSRLFGLTPRSRRPAARPRSRHFASGGEEFVQSRRNPLSALRQNRLVVLNAEQRCFGRNGLSLKHFHSVLRHKWWKIDGRRFIADTGISLPADE